jgi:hypothetical protein
MFHENPSEIKGAMAISRSVKCIPFLVAGFSALV